MGWFSLQLLAACEEFTESMWREAWNVSYAESEVDPGNGVFLKGTGRSPAKLYFSPAARELAEVFGAKACDKPSSEHMYVVAGHERAWETHFPGSAPAKGSGREGGGRVIVQRSGYEPTEPMRHLSESSLPPRA